MTGPNKSPTVKGFPAQVTKGTPEHRVRLLEDRSVSDESFVDAGFDNPVTFSR